MSLIKVITFYFYLCLISSVFSGIFSSNLGEDSNNTHSDSDHRVMKIVLQSKTAALKDEEEVKRAEKIRIRYTDANQICLPFLNV